MLGDDLKKRMMAAMKACKAATEPALVRRANVEKELWRTALGEITMVANTSGSGITDELVISTLKKLMKGNEDTSKVVTDDEQKEQLAIEKELLLEVLPAGLSPDAVKALLAGVLEQLRAAKSDGQAVGVAMKALKAAGQDVDGKLVSAVVAELRQSAQ